MILESVKKQYGVSCWLCEHFQRYMHGNMQFCSGECRLKPPFADEQGQMPYVPPPGPTGSYIFRFYWPTIENGDLGWCGRFQRSVEKNLPESPWTPEEGCPLPEGDKLYDVHEAFWREPWNKMVLPGYVANKEDGVCCLNCDHFQPLGGQPDYNGECHANPPWAWQEMTVGMAPDEGFANGIFPQIPKGICFWCAQWEKTKRPIPDDANWDCFLRN